MRNLPSYRTSLLRAASCAILGLAACGGISDPAQNDHGDGPVATVRGALTGADAPDGAHVAVVWRVGTKGTLAVGSDAIVTDGSFTINLPPPPDAYFFEPKDTSIDSVDVVPPDVSGGDGYDPGPPSTFDAGPAPAPEDTTESRALGGRLRPLDGLSGTVSKPLGMALAGFVVYVDTNGNGTLDISGTYAESSDEIIGGNEELALVFFRNGTTLAYEKLRDESGTVPAAGYNLAWLDKGRWLPLDSVELELDAKKGTLPEAVCAKDGSTRDDLAAEPYNPNTDPPRPKNVTCSPDGRSYTVCPEAPPAAGLCSSSASDAACLGEALAMDTPVPDGWPCPVPDTSAGAP